MSKKEISSARDVAEAAEAAARLAIERVQSAESQLDQFGAARYPKHEVTQMREEANGALQLTQETKRTGSEVIPLQNVDEEEENNSEAH